MSGSALKWVSSCLSSSFHFSSTFLDPSSGVIHSRNERKDIFYLGSLFPGHRPPWLPPGQVWQPGHRGDGFRTGDLGKQGRKGRKRKGPPTTALCSASFFKINLSFLTNNQEYQDEVVTFTSTIYPIDAKGMVEKWLLQVEIQNKKILTKTSQTRISITTKHRLKNRWCAHWGTPSRRRWPTLPLPSWSLIISSYIVSCCI